MKVLIYIAIIAVGLTQVLGQQDPNCCTMACCVNGDEYKCNMAANACFSAENSRVVQNVARAIMVLSAPSLKLNRQVAVAVAAVAVAAVVVVMSKSALPGA